VKKLIYKWRYYTFSKQECSECISKTFDRNNLAALQRANSLVFLLSVCFSMFPIFFEKDYVKAGVYFIVAGFALIMSIFARYRRTQYKRGKTQVAESIRFWIVLYYMNVMFFGIYVGAIRNTIGIDGTFIGFLIVALFLFANSPTFNLLLTLIALVSFFAASIYLKEPKYWTYDITNSILAAIVGLYFGWHINRYRIMAALSAMRLEEERNKYHDESKIDELTKLKNRRDFMFTFKRRLTTYRFPDDTLCIAIIDIDCFKNYNDFYGHPQGDECLRVVGKALNDLSAATGIYAARIGGEEFCLLWFTSAERKVDNVVSQIFTAIKSLQLPHEKTTVENQSSITVSIGVYVVRCETSNDMDGIYKLADDALYEAKKSGRNCAFIDGTGVERYRLALED
jgi:diguanylate cyclase (GGDEF)-like protein